GDFDGNGYLDLYCTNVPFGNPLFMNQGGGLFTEESGPAGVAAYRFGWSAHFLDFDNDTHLDLHVCNWNTPNLLYRHTGAFPCVDLADPLGLVSDGDDSTSSSTADIDLDGDVDILVTALDKPLRLFVNQEGHLSSWIAVELKNPSSSGNLHAIGATIDVTAGGVTRTRYVGAGEGFRGQNSFVQSFGLGSATLVEEIHVIWPGGDETSVFDVLPGQRVVLTPSGVLDAGFVRGDVSGGGSVDVADVVGSLSYLFLGGNATCLDAADFDDNGAVDVSDPVATLAFLFTGGSPPALPYPACG
ncbi:MAG: FG-GAP-like repeat-containing protein, partial [Planctomycetota bacterium]